MKHAIGGFGAGWLLCAALDALVLVVQGKSTKADSTTYCIWGVIGAMAAWGLLP